MAWLEDWSDGVSHDVQRPNEKLCRDRPLQWTLDSHAVRGIMIRIFWAMGWDWMVVNQSLEEELELERSVREIQVATDEDALKAFCVSLLRTNWHRPSY